MIKNNILQLLLPPHPTPPPLPPSYLFHKLWINQSQKKDNSIALYMHLRSIIYTPIAYDSNGRSRFECRSSSNDPDVMDDLGL